MKLDYQKELTPVLYGDSAVKILAEMNAIPNGLCFSTHWHERMELLLILSGEMDVTVDNIRDNAKCNSVVIIPPGKPHSGVAGNTGVKYRTFMFDITAFYNSTHASNKYLPPISEQNTDFITVTDNMEIVGVIQSLLDTQLSGEAYASLVSVGKIYEIIGLLYRYCLSDETKPLHDSRFKNVIEYIEENYGDNISTAYLSRKFGYDEAYFCRRFKEIAGLTPMNYVQILRLESARKKIKTTNLKISEISALCGFSDPGYFSKCFKKRYGKTPNEYSAGVRLNRS